MIGGIREKKNEHITRGTFRTQKHKLDHISGNSCENHDDINNRSIEQTPCQRCLASPPPQCKHEGSQLETKGRSHDHREEEAVKGYRGVVIYTANEKPRKRRYLLEFIVIYSFV